MKKSLILLLAAIALGASEKIFVVERSDESLAVLENHAFKSRIKGMHNLNHAVVKFQGKDGYVITRDGYVIKFDPIKERITKEYKSSESSIGFLAEKNYVAVANYDNKTVEILDTDLNPLQLFKTDSKNVGIKRFENYLVFALMDKDELWVLKDKNEGEGKPEFEIFKKFENVGVAPFDAMIKDHLYIVGFFGSPHFGVLDLKNMEYSKIQLTLEEKKPVLKVPHFGFWSIGGDKIFVPAVGNNKVFVYDKNFGFIKTVETEGLPVFTALSPDERYLAVTFSGEKFPVIQIVDTQSLQIIKRFEFAGSVLHVRWSKQEPLLYVSVNTTDEVIALDTKEWKEAFKTTVKKPSGIFIFE